MINSPVNQLKIYMHHDISTAPLVDKKKEKKLFQRLVKYDLIFSPQKKSSLMFHKFLNKHNNKKFLKISLLFMKLDTQN